MKIIIVNLRYFFSGGPERYMFNITDLLEENGHKVIPFSIKHRSNKPSEYEGYFLDPIGKGEEVYFRNYKKNNLKDIIRLFGRLFYSFEARHKLSRLIKETKPDMIYVLYYQNKISPSIFDAARKLNIPVVVRISDFGMICATNVLFAFGKGEICEKCVARKRRYLIYYKCFHGSFLYSVLKYLSYQLHDLLNIQGKIDAFVIPSKFTAGKFIDYGVPRDKIFHIPTFFNFRNTSFLPEYGDFALYFGRIDPDKGIKTMVDAFINTQYKLIIIGFSSSDYDKFISDYLAGKEHAITLKGKMEFEEIVPYLEKCCFTILSSEIYDNFPNAVLESFAYKKAVIASRIGSLVELVEDNVTGLLFNYRDTNDLQAKVRELFADKVRARQLGENGFNKLNSEFSTENHYKSLIKLFSSFK